MLKARTYDVLKELALVWLPAAGTLYFALAGIWHFPAAEQVVGSIVAVDTFLGVVLKISSSQYNKPTTSGGKYDGVFVITPKEDGTKTVSLELNENAGAIQDKDELRFKVQQ